MPAETLRGPPLGGRMPPNNRHALISSLSTWESSGAIARGEEWVTGKMQTGYPRFFMNEPVRQLNKAILTRLGLSKDSKITCMVFVSAQAAKRCMDLLSKSVTDGNKALCVHFSQPEEKTIDGFWAQFYVVIYSTHHSTIASRYWRDSGDGISTRHAEFCLLWFEYLESKSSNRDFCTPPIKQLDSKSKLMRLGTSGFAEETAIKQDIANLAQSEQLGHGPAATSDIFLYPGGMSAISAVARALAGPYTRSGVAAFGYLYTETFNILESNWQGLITYPHGTPEDLDDLGALLESGLRIDALWTEVPGNPKLVTPDMHRIRQLADKHRFIVICDETVGTFINTDLLPYVDVLVTSLTKMYSGRCDVTGGSVIVNPKSPSYGYLHRQLRHSYEATFFPSNLAVLHENSRDFVERVQLTNHNAKAVADLLTAHPTVEKVNYPSITTPDMYERYRRERGGYGHLLSVIFKRPVSAARFYNTFEGCKGTSFGTIFTLLTAYAQFGTQTQQDEMARHGVPSHLVRVSVGVEDLNGILAAITRALKKVEQLETSMCMDKH